MLDKWFPRRTVVVRMAQSRCPIVDTKIAVQKKKFELGKMLDKISDLEKKSVHMHPHFLQYIWRIL